MDNDAGNNSLVSYSLSGPGAELFSVLDNGAVIFTGGSPENIATLDRELTERYELLVTARDRGNLSSSTYLTIRVDDENDNAPVFQHGPLKVLLPETARPGARVAQVQAIDIDEKGTPNSKIDYAITAGKYLQKKSQLLIIISYRYCSLNCSLKMTVILGNYHLAKSNVRYFRECISRRGMGVNFYKI